MFERFTPGARQAVVSAQEVARTHGSAGIEPSHILLAVLQLDGDEAIAATLGTLVPSVADLCPEVDAVVVRGDHATTDAIPFTPDAKEILVRAAVLAKNLKVGHIGTEHLLLAVAGGADPTAAVLARHGADRDSLLAVMRDRSGAPGFEVRTTRGFGRFKRRGGGSSSSGTPPA